MYRTPFNGTTFSTQGQKQTDHEVEMRLLVHTSHAGGIIGRGGQRIRELRDVSHHAIIRDEYFNLKLTPLANQSCNKGLHPTMPSRKSFNFSLQIILLIHLLSPSKHRVPKEYVRFRVLHL